MIGPAKAVGAAFRRPASFAVLGGILLAIAATWPAAGTPGAPSRLLFLHLPQWLGVCAVIALASVALPLFAAMLPAPRRRDPDDFELEPMPPPEGGKRAAFLLLALLLLGATGTVWFVARLLREQGPASARISTLAPVAPSRPQPTSAAPPRSLHIPLADHAATLVIALGSVAALAAAIWILSENSWHFSNPAGRRRRRLAQVVAEAVVAGLAELADDPDPRRAVIACYRRCEAAVAEVRRRRYPWQTPREFVEAALVALSLPQTAVRSLLSVFERARFGNEPISAADRATALAALGEIRGEIRAALAEEKEHGTRR